MTTSLFRSTANQHRCTRIYLDNQKLDPRRNHVETTTDKNRGILLLYAYFVDNCLWLHCKNVS